MQRSLFKSAFKGQIGFTLIELITVMGIVSVLSAVVIFSVAGIKDSGRLATARQDADTASTATGEFFSNQRGSGTVTSSPVTVTASINGDTPAEHTQEISSRWPEQFISEDVASAGTSFYFNEFPTAGVATSSTVAEVVILDRDGLDIGRETLLERYTAIDFDILLEQGYIQKASGSVDQIEEAEGHEFHNFLWLLRRESSAAESGDADSRVLELFRLAAIEIDDAATPAVTLTYEQVN